MEGIPVPVRTGATSPTNNIGTTGRVTATVVSNSTLNTNAGHGSTSNPAAVSSSSTVAPAAVAEESATTAAKTTDGTSMLSAPLGLQASVLSQPMFYPSLGEDMGDFSEEGDILFAVLGDPWRRVRGGHDVGNHEATAAESTHGNEETMTTGAPDVRTSPLEIPVQSSLGPITATAAHSYPLSGGLCSSTALCVQPVLTLPRKVGVSLAGEVFRALLCFHNAATYSLSQAHFRVSLARPPGPLRRPLLHRTVPSLPPKSNYTVVVAVALNDACSYSLAVSVDYYDSSECQRQLLWNSTLKAEQPITEVEPRQLAYLRPCVPTKGEAHSSSSSSSSHAYARYLLTVGLKNMSSVPLIMTASELLLPALIHHDGKPLFTDLTPTAATAGAALDFHSLHGRRNANNGGLLNPSFPALLMPGDTQTLVFLVGLYLEELRRATVVHGQGGVTTKLLSPRLTSFGHVEWTWCRMNGETGTARSAPLRVAQLVAEPDVVLRVVAVVPTPGTNKPPVAAPHIGSLASSAAATTVEDATHSISLEDVRHPFTHPSLSSASLTAPAMPLLTGYPVAIHFALQNHSSIHRYDVALKVHVERLAPQWLYTGPTVRPLGLLEPSRTLNFSLNLLPWQAGWLQVLQAAMEVVDAQMPEAVLWPPASMSLLQPVENQHGSFSATVTSTTTTASTASPDSKDGADRQPFAATLPAVVRTAMKATLPADGNVLCEVLVF